MLSSEAPGSPDVSWNPHNPMTYVAASPLYTWRNWSSESTCNSPKVTQLTCCRPVLQPMMSTPRGVTVYTLLSCVQRATCPCLAPLWVLTAFLFLSPLDNQPSQLLTSKGLVCLGFRNGAKGQFTQIQGPPLLTSDLGVQSPVSKMDMKYPE